MANRELTADEVTLSIDPATFGFESTDDLEPLDGIVGQPRAMRALDLGLGVRHRNYHIYVSGLEGTGRLDLIRDAIKDRTTHSQVPPDWIYVNNFEEHDRPVAISLPAGTSPGLRREMEDLVEYLREALPRAFRQEDFGNERERLRREYREKGQASLKQLEEVAARYEMAVQQLPDGQILFIPLKDGRPMTPEELETLTPEQMKDLNSHQDDLVQAAEKVIRRQSELHKQLSADVRNVARQFAEKLVEPCINRIRSKFVREPPPTPTSGRGKEFDEFGDHRRISEWLDRLKDHVLEKLERFRDIGDTGESTLAMADGDDSDLEQRFPEFQVNVLVDNSTKERAPIVVERASTYSNLFGTIDRVVDRSGRVITNFTRIKSGALLRANGGYLVLDLMDVLMEPFVWKQLKRTLKSGWLEIEVYDPFSIFTVSGLKPEPIPLDVRIVAAGDALIYHLLYLYDDDFREIFRVKADFDDEMSRNQEAGKLYGGLGRRLSDTEGLRPLEATAVAVLVREGARLASSQKKLSTLFSHLADIVREADYWAGGDDATQVTAAHVEQALRERVHRSDLVAEKLRDLIDEGSLLIDVAGQTLGQINALSVTDLGDYRFGRPSRMTASVGVGASGIVNIERESRLSGRTFDKGLLILEGYLRRKYAGDMPLALSASLAMEQSYGGIDGDSASAAELLCLLSAIADLPLRQDIAITGSINQAGEIQAIGGVNEKIEGFFDVCNHRGLTGSQGVCIPSSNTQHLVLRPDVVESIREGRFHVWPVDTIDEAAELLTGISAGEVEDSTGLHGRVAARLAEIVQILSERTFMSDRMIWTPGMPTDLPADPRPPFPGRDSESPVDGQDVTNAARSFVATDKSSG